MLDKLSNGVFFIKRLVKFIVNVKYKSVLTNKIISFLTWKNYVFWRENYVLTRKITFFFFPFLWYVVSWHTFYYIVEKLLQCVNFFLSNLINNFYLRLWRVMLGKVNVFVGIFYFVRVFYKSYVFFPRNIFYIAVNGLN